MVGGSLYDHPRLGPACGPYLDALGSPVLLVPGGGVLADAVRRLDRTHRLGARGRPLARPPGASRSPRSLLTRVVGAALPLRRLRVAAKRARLLRLRRRGRVTTPATCRPSWDATPPTRIAARAAVVYCAERLNPCSSPLTSPRERRGPRPPNAVGRSTLPQARRRTRPASRGGQLPPAPRRAFGRGPELPASRSPAGPLNRVLYSG